MNPEVLLSVRNTCPKELLGESNLQVTVLTGDNVVKRRRKQELEEVQEGITATKDIREGSEGRQRLS